MCFNTYKNNFKEKKRMEEDKEYRNAAKNIKIEVERSDTLDKNENNFQPATICESPVNVPLKHSLS